MKSKGQVFMTDFMASIAIMGAMLALFAMMWNMGVDSQISFRDGEQLKDRAERTADYFVSTPGYPEDWEETGDVQIPGFATSQNVLSLDKIEAFENMSYEDQRDIVKVQDFGLEFRNESGKIPGYEALTGEESDSNPFDQGQDVPGDARTVVKADRDVAVNISGELVPMEVNFLAWRR